MLEQLLREWEHAKQIETSAQANRRAIEDKITEALGIAETFEGQRKLEHGGYKLTATARMSRKVDAEAVAEIAAAHGLESHAQSLFRFKTELNIPAWKAAAQEITRPFAPAITTKPGRITYKIEKIED